MKIIRKDDVPPALGKTFTGHVELQRVLDAQTPGGMSLNMVHFKNGARTHWHIHPGEQVLFVVEGQCRMGTADGEEAVLGPGDIAYAPPGEKHWHGAGTEGPFSHLSIARGKMDIVD